MDYTCLVCGGPLGYEPEFCCNGSECGCYGQPIDPPICSQECWEKYMKPRDRDYGVNKEPLPG